MHIWKQKENNKGEPKSKDVTDTQEESPSEMTEWQKVQSRSGLLGKAEGRPPDLAIRKPLVKLGN